MEVFSVSIVLIVSSLVLLYKWYTANFDYFDKKGIKCIKPELLKLGKPGWPFKSICITEALREMYNKYPEEELVGTFQFRRPVYFIKSIELLKKITTKDFAHFQDHNDMINAEFDELFASTLVSMRGKRWREMRLALTPAFTGSKMRLMLQFINKCCHQLVSYINTELQTSQQKAFSVKEVFAKYTNDVVATCAFGVECNSFKEPNNEIYLAGKEFADFQKPFRIYKLALSFFFPKLANIFGLEVFSEEKKKRFRDIIIETMETREKNGIIRPDMINILMELKKSNVTRDEIEGKRVWTETELIAQCFQFFLAGFETSSALMTFIAYELAVNPEIQDKLIQEIDETHKNLKSQPLTYESLSKMKYLNMIVLEILRKWPPAPATDRICVQDYQYEDNSGHIINIDKGTLFTVPIYAFHMDPANFPDPEKFYPERFSEENNPKLDAFIPFGAGPRNCIGFRFALMETKALFYHTLHSFKINVGKDTQVPLKLKKTVFGIFPETPIMLYFVPREKHI